MVTSNADFVSDFLGWRIEPSANANKAGNATQVVETSVVRVSRSAHPGQAMKRLPALWWN